MKNDDESNSLLIGSIGMAPGFLLSVLMYKGEIYGLEFLISFLLSTLLFNMIVFISSVCYIKVFAFNFSNLFLIFGPLRFFYQTFEMNDETKNLLFLVPLIYLIIFVFISKKEISYQKYKIINKDLELKEIIKQLNLKNKITYFDFKKFLFLKEKEILKNKNKMRKENNLKREIKEKNNLENIKKELMI